MPENQFEKSDIIMLAAAIAVSAARTWTCEPRPRGFAPRRTAVAALRPTFA